jgi:hypothetical protein
MCLPRTHLVPGVVNVETSPYPILAHRSAGAADVF